MVPTMINGRWSLLLPRHRHERPHWPWWEAARLSAMHHVVTEMVERLGRTPVVYDVGAEEGDLPALWATWGADVVLFEPNPRVWPNIRAIWEANTIPDPLFCFPGFAGPTTDLTAGVVYKATVDGPDVWPDCAYGPVIGDHGFCNLCERPDLPRLRLDEASQSPDVVTVDVEGAEWEVLKGAVRTLTDSKPVVFVSVHPQFMETMYSQSSGELFEWMEGFGYVWQFLATDHEGHWVAQHPDNMWLPVDA